MQIAVAFPPPPASFRPWLKALHVLLNCHMIRAETNRVGNAAEHFTAVSVSVKDKLDLSISVAVSRRTRGRCGEGFLV